MTHDALTHVVTALWRSIARLVPAAAREALDTQRTALEHLHEEHAAMREQAGYERGLAEAAASVEDAKVAAYRAGVLIGHGQMLANTSESAAVSEIEH